MRLVSDGLLKRPELLEEAVSTSARQDVTHPTKQGVDYFFVNLVLENVILIFGRGYICVLNFAGRFVKVLVKVSCGLNYDVIYTKLFKVVSYFQSV